MKQKIDLLEFGIDPDQCCYCAKDKEWTDRYGLPWCKDHKHRGELLNWGILHQWPDLQCFPYAVGPGECCWYTAVVAGNNELIGMALSAIESSDENFEALRSGPAETQKKPSALKPWHGPKTGQIGEISKSTLTSPESTGEREVFTL